MHSDGFVTALVMINEEQLKGKGEDSVLGIIQPNVSLFVSLDGCGGAGAQQYSSAGGMSGARISAEHTGMALRSWFLNSGYGFIGTGLRSDKEIAAEMRNAICLELRDVEKQLGPSQSSVQSKLSRTFPTTLAAVMVEAEDTNLLRCVSFWAGDSRTYIFRCSGLQQTSRDDLRGGRDPFDVLGNDGKLSNIICADGMFEIHSRTDTITEPCIVLTATDGCFSYYASPIQFEWVLLETISQSSGPLDWENRLRKEIGAYAADDYTVSAAVIGFQNWEAVRQAYRFRKEQLETEYLTDIQRALEQDDQEAHRQIWLRYKHQYMMEEGSE